MPNTYTPFLNLGKPDPVDPIDVAVLNTNMDLIDANLGAANILSPIPLSTALVGAYPLGTSMFSLSSAAIAADSGWQAIGYSPSLAEVYTFKPATDRATQFWFRNGSMAEGFYRHLGTSSNTAWRAFGDSDSCALNSTGDVVIVDSTWTRMSETTIETQHGFNVAYSNGGVVIRTAGLYRVEITISANGSAGTSIVYAGFGQLNDAGPSTFYRVTGNPGAGSITLNGSWTKVMAAGETVYIFVEHITGASKTFNNRRLVVQRVSPAP